MHRFLRFSIVIFLLLICTSCSLSSANKSLPSLSTPQVTESTKTNALTSEELFFLTRLIDQWHLLKQSLPVCAILTIIIAGIICRNAKYFHFLKQYIL